MKMSRTLLSVLMIGTMFLVGCGGGTQKGGEKKPANTKEKDEKDGHAHGKGPNGGVVFDFGRYHAEFTVDHKAKECTILILGLDEKTAKQITAKDLTVITKETKTKEGSKVAPMTIKMLPKDEKEGKASKFVGSDPGLGNVADFEGTVVGEINGKRAEGEFKEE